MTDRNIYSVNIGDNITDIIKQFKHIALYGTGKVADLFCARYSSLFSGFDSIRFFKTSIVPNEKYRNKEVLCYKDLKEYPIDTGILIIATHENFQRDILETMGDIYKGKVLCLSNPFINDLSHELDVREANHNGKIAVTYTDIPNMGDLLNPVLISKLYNTSVYNESLRFSNVTGIGSLMEGLYTDRDETSIAEYPLYIWGSGFSYRNPINDKYPIRKNIQYCCLRGHKSKEKLEQYYGHSISCVLGDPGLLASFIQDPNIEKRFSIGIISHYREQELDILSDLYNIYKNAVLINLRNKPELVLQQIAECEVVISSSLHGAIVADSFGIPNILVQISDRPYTDGFRYEDYYSVFGLDGNRIDLRNGSIPTIEYIRENYSVSQDIVKRVTDDVLNSFPKEILID